MAESRLELVIDSRSAERELRRLEGRLQGVDRAGDRADRSVQGLGRELGGLRTVALAAGGAFAAMGISSLGRDVFNTVASVEKMRASLETVTGSIGSANAAWDQMREFAKTTPFELDQSVKAFIRMKSLGLDPTEDALRSFANTSAAMGTDLMQMVEAVADATTGEFERLKEYGIKASQDGDKVALTFQGNTTSIRNNAREIQRYLENIGNTNFADAAIDQMDTLGGKANNLSDSITDLYLAIGEAGATELFNAALDGTASTVNYLEENIETLAKGFDLLSDAAIIAAGIFGGRFVAAMAAGTVAAVNRTAASIAGAKADAAAAAAITRRTGAELAAAKAMLSTAQIDVAATRGTAAHTFALNQLSAARTRTATAAGIHARATTVSTAAMARANVGARALTGSMALLGGPIGLLIGAAGLLYVFRDELNLTGQRAGLTETQISDLRDEMQDMSQDDLSDSLSTLNSSLDAATLKAATAREELSQLRSENRGSGALGFGAGQVGAEISGLQAVADAKEKIVELDQRIAVARGEAASRIEDSANAYVVYADKVDKSAEETKRAEELNTTLSASAADAADKTYTLADAYESLLDRITPNRREARQYAQDLGVLNLALASGRINTTQYMQAMGLLQESFQAAQRDSTDLSDTVTDGTDEMTREMERFGNAVDDVFVDAFKGAFDSFEDFADRLKNAFETLMAELAYAAVKNEIKIQLGMNASGQGGMMQGGGGQGGFNLNPSTLKSGWDTASGWFGGGGASAGSAAQGYGGAGWANSATSGGGWYGSATSSGASGGMSAMGGAYYAGAAIIGNEVGDAVSGAITDKQANSNYGQMAGTAIGSIWGPIGAGIGSAIGSVGDSLFGSYTPFQGRFGTTGTLNAGTEGGGSDGVFEHQDDGRFYEKSALGYVGFRDRGTERLQRAGTGDKQWAEDLTNATAQMDNLVASLASGASEIDAMRDAVQGLEASGRNAADIVDFALKERPRAALEEIGGHFGDFVRGLSGGIEQVVQQAQFGQQALQVLAGSVERLNLQFDDTGAAAYQAASDLAIMAGGTKNLAALQQNYHQSMLTDSEKLELMRADLAAGFSALGESIPESKKGFRELAEAQNLNTKAGREHYIQLMTLVDGFNAFSEASKQVVTELDEMAKTAADAVSAAEDDVRALYKAFMNTAAGQETALLELAGDKQAIIAIQREKELAAIDESLRPTQERIWALQDEAQAQREAAKAGQDYVSELERVRNELSNTLGGISNWIDQRNATKQSPTDNLSASREQFEEQLKLAQGGDRDALQSITQYADRLLAGSEDMFASGPDAQAEREKVLAALESLPDAVSAEQYIADEIRQALEDSVGDLPGGISSALSPLFDSIDLDEDKLIDYGEFSKFFEGLASDSELQNIFSKLDRNGDGTISAIEAGNLSTDGVEGNTEGIDDQARDQLDVLGNLVEEMTRSTDQFLGLESTLSSLSDSITALGVAQKEAARIEKERQASELKARGVVEKDRIASAISRRDDLQGSVNSQSREVSSGKNYSSRRANQELFESFTRSPGRLQRMYDGGYDYFYSVVDGREQKVWEDDWQKIHAAAARQRALERRLADAKKSIPGTSSNKLEDFRKDYRDLMGEKAPFAKGGAFTNSIVSQPTMFDMGLMGEAGPEAIMPLNRSADGSLGIRAELPPISLPPLLGGGDVVEVLQDLRREVAELRKENTRLQGEGNRHAAASVQVQQTGFQRQIAEQKKGNRSLDEISAGSRLEASR